MTVFVGCCWSYFYYFFSHGFLVWNRVTRTEMEIAVYIRMGTNAVTQPRPHHPTQGLAATARGYSRLNERQRYQGGATSTDGKPKTH